MAEEGDGAPSEASEWENREREEQLALLREEECNGRQAKLQVTHRKEREVSRRQRRVEQGKARQGYSVATERDD